MEQLTAPTLDFEPMYRPPSHELSTVASAIMVMLVINGLRHGRLVNFKRAKGV